MALVIVSATLNLARAASEGSAGYGSAPESDSSHPRTAPAHDEEGSCTSRRCLAPCRPTADRWIVETSPCRYDPTPTARTTGKDPPYVHHKTAQPAAVLVCSPTLRDHFTHRRSTVRCDR